MHAWYESGKFKQVADFYNANPKDFSTDALPEVLLLAGNAERKLANYKESLPLYSTGHRANYPDSADAKEAQYQRLASLYYTDDPGLGGEIDKYVAQNAGSDKIPQLTLMKAEALYRKQKYTEAIPVYASLTGSALPDELMADSEFKLGWCQMQTKNYPDAIKSFSEFLATYPKNKLAPSALAQRALASQQTKDFTSALKDFNEIDHRGYPEGEGARTGTRTESAASRRAAG